METTLYKMIQVQDLGIWILKDHLTKSLLKINGCLYTHLSKLYYLKHFKQTQTAYIQAKLLSLTFITNLSANYSRVSSQYFSSFASTWHIM